MSTSAPINPQDLASFQDNLSKSTRIVALLGAGLSASSGLPTYRGVGGFWRTHDATTIATLEAFEADPAFVWQFYSYRRHMALVALSQRKPKFLTLSQNVDGLSSRAGHPDTQLRLLHGNLFGVKCSNAPTCTYKRANDFSDPIVPALALPQEVLDAERVLQQGGHDGPDSSSNLDTANHSTTQPEHPLPRVPVSSLPQCPHCSSLLRPDIVWFGEALNTNLLASIRAYFDDPQPVDLMLVIGTSATVYPAASYTQVARMRGARIAIINMEVDDIVRASELRPGLDWAFVGDAATIVPELFRGEIGEVEPFAG